jgi:hypothetical protein
MGLEHPRINILAVVRSNKPCGRHTTRVAANEFAARTLVRARETCDSRYHYAVALKKVKGGWRVESALDFPSRGQADKYSLTLLARFGDASSLTLEREIRVGEVLDAATLRR